MTEQATAADRLPHAFDLDDDQPTWAPEGGYCRCGWVENARVHQVTPTARLRLTLPAVLNPAQVARIVGIAAKGLWRYDTELQPFRTPGNTRRYHRDHVLDAYDAIQGKWRR